MRPFEARDLPARLGLFLAPLPLAVVVMAAGLVAVAIAHALVATALAAFTLAVVLLAPWHRLPASAQVAPPLLALAVLAVLIAGGDGAGVSPLVLLVVGPVVWMAVYHDPAQVWAGVAGAGLAVAVGGTLAGQDTGTAVATTTMMVAACTAMALTIFRLLAAERDAQRVAIAARDEQRRAAARLADSERDHRLLTESASDMISRHDLDGAFLYVSAACRPLLGYEPDELLGRQVRDLVAPADHEVLKHGRRRLAVSGQATDELRMVHRDGGVVWVEQRVRLVGDEAHSTVRDVTARREAERRLAHLATHDDLTGLWNRRRFDEALREEIARADRRGPDAVMLLIDLDDFKAVNDGHGHLAGDRLLVAVADAIRSRMRDGDGAGRLGGDEFAVLLRGTSPDRAERVADVYREAIGAAAIELGGGSVSPSASVGWAVVSADSPDERSVMAGADSAMYRVKALRRQLS